MSFQPFDEMLEKNPTPEEYITELFERTDEDGILYIPAKHTFMGVFEPEPDYDYRIEMKWNISKCESVIKKFNTVLEALKKVAPFEDELRNFPERAKSILKSPELYHFWYIYVRNFETPGYDLQKIVELDELFETMSFAQDIARRFSKGKELNEYEREILEESLKTKVLAEDEEYYDSYHALRRIQSEERIGDNIFAYETILFAQRFCRLIWLGAPDVIVNNEARSFAESFVLHEYGVCVKTTSSSVRNSIEMMEQMTEDELDEYDSKRPQTNTLKSMLPLFVYKILQKHSSGEKHLHLKKISELLQSPPYELKIERKALGRTLHGIENISDFAVYHDKNGWWKE